MTLMKLKLAMQLKDLSYRFCVSVSAVSRVFSVLKGALDIRLITGQILRTILPEETVQERHSGS